MPGRSLSSSAVFKLLTRFTSCTRKEWQCPKFLSQENTVLSPDSQLESYDGVGGILNSEEKKKRLIKLRKSTQRLQAMECVCWGWSFSLTCTVSYRAKCFMPCNTSSCLKISYCNHFFLISSAAACVCHSWR